MIEPEKSIHAAPPGQYDGRGEMLVPVPEDRIAPASLAAVAALLALRDKSQKPVQRYFPAAERLLKSAGEYLSEHSKSVDEFFETLGVKELSFDEILEPVVPVESGAKAKKPKTMLGAITTKAGLKVAVKRVFTANGLADAILKRRSLSKGEITAILADQAERAKKAKNPVK